MHSILRHNATFFPAFRRLSAHGAHTRGNYHQTEIRLLEGPSPTKGEICQRDISPLRRKDAEEWGIDIERRIDRQEPTTTRQSRDVQIFGDLVALHRQDLEEVGKDIGRSKAASLIFLDERLGHLRLPELDRERFIKFGKARALEGAGPVVGTAFRRQCKGLKIEDLHFHDLRHEGTSRLFEAGFSIEQVALVTGHKDWKMLRRYTHLKPETLHLQRKTNVA